MGSSVAAAVTTELCVVQLHSRGMWNECQCSYVLIIALGDSVPKGARVAGKCLTLSKYKYRENQANTFQ